MERIEGERASVVLAEDQDHVVAAEPERVRNRNGGLPVSQFGDDVGQPDLGGSSPRLMAIRQATASTAPLAPSACPVVPLIDEIGG